MVGEERTLTSLILCRVGGQRFPTSLRKNIKSYSTYTLQTSPHESYSDADVKLGHRLLYYAHADLWLSDDDKDWHYPLLVTLREQGTK